MENYRIDSHKLMFHPRRIAEWLEKGDTYPISVEVSPSGRCNHKCIFCALDFTGYNNPYLLPKILGERLEEMQRLGVKAIIFAGEGEPLLHPNIRNILVHTKEIGLDESVSTNGVFLGRILEECLKHLTWIRISLDALEQGTYSYIHGCKGEDLSSVMAGLEVMCKLRKGNRYDCTIGTQLLLLRENLNEVIPLARLLRSTGVDYLSIKPYSQHPLSHNRLNPNFSELELMELQKKLEEEETPGFQIVFRNEALKRVGKEKSYSKCLGLPFFCYIDSKGDVYTCSTYIGNLNFSYGNIYSNTFEEIWKSDKRKEVLSHVDKLDISACRENCRLDPINNYLWELTHPPTHVNFI